MRPSPPLCIGDRKTAHAACQGGRVRLGSKPCEAPRHPSGPGLTTRRRRVLAWPAVALAGLFACRSGDDNIPQDSPAPREAPAPVAGPVASPAPSTTAFQVPDGGPARGVAFPDGGLASLPDVSAQAAWSPDGGAPLLPDAVNGVDPAATFDVRVRVRLPAARLVLLDAQDAIVASSGTTEVGPETVFRIVPADALRPGSTYLLRLEGLSARALVDTDGRSYEPLSFRLRAAGDPPPATRRKSSRRRSDR